MMSHRSIHLLYNLIPFKKKRNIFTFMLLNKSSTKDEHFTRRLHITLSLTLFFLSPKTPQSKIRLISFINTKECFFHSNTFWRLSFLIYRFLRYLRKSKFYAAVAHSETQTRELQHSSRRPTAGGRFRMFQILNQSNSQILSISKYQTSGVTSAGRIFAIVPILFQFLDIISTVYCHGCHPLANLAEKNNCYLSVFKSINAYFNENMPQKSEQTFPQTCPYRFGT